MLFQPSSEPVFTNPFEFALKKFVMLNDPLILFGLAEVVVAHESVICALTLFLKRSVFAVAFASVDELSIRRPTG